MLVAEGRVDVMADVNDAVADIGNGIEDVDRKAIQCRRKGRHLAVVRDIEVSKGRVAKRAIHLGDSAFADDPLT
jgi:hypothetical protein